MSTEVTTAEAARPRAAPRRHTRWRPLAAAAGVVGELMITLGLVLLLFVAWQLWWTDVEANRVQAKTITTLENDFGPGGAGAAADPKDPLATLKDVPLGKAFAILRVPRFGKGYARPILQGTGHDTLNQGLGHYQGTAMPARVGNFAIAGHRTTYGRPLHDVELLRAGDVLIVETKTAYDVYRVARHVIVRPTAVDVVAPVPQDPGATPTQAWMTMTTCHPKFSAEFRYVVFAKFERAFARAAGLPASYVKVTGKVAS
ncbi:MAG TPA: class E sortase [Dermatophilaceae bacterium]|nr:class E sortase [Dermatophilaceae bacterium]